MRKYWFIYLLVLVFLPIAQHANGVDLFSQCTKGFDFGTTPTKQVTVYPINPTCATTCANQCQVFSVSVGTASSPAELNSDIILNCRLACQLGEKFSSYYRILPNTPGSTIPIPSSSPQTITAPCTTDAATSSTRIRTATETIAGTLSVNVDAMAPMDPKNFAYTDSGVAVSNGDTIKLSIGVPTATTSHLAQNTISSTSDPFIGNNVYMCGARAVTLQPLNPIYDPSYWSIVGNNGAHATDSGANFPFAFNGVNCANDPNFSLSDSAHNFINGNSVSKYCTSNICLKKYFDANPGISPNELIWRDPGNGIPIFTNAGTPFNAFEMDVCTWAVNKPTYTPLGMPVNDGDQLDITFGGRNCINAEGNPTICNTTWDRNAAYQANNLNNFSYLSTLEFQDAAMPNATTGIQLAPETQKHFNCIGKQTTCKDGSSHSQYLQDLANGTLYTWNGLKITAYDDNITTAVNTAATTPNGESCAVAEIAIANPDACRSITNIGFSKYSLSGIVNGLGSISNLSVRVYDGDTPEWYNDNYGNSEVSITWKGCPVAAEQSLQYTVAPAGTSLDPGIDWTDVPAAAFTNAGFAVTATAPGNVYFRVKPLGGTGERYTNYGYRLGQINLAVTPNAAADGTCSQGSTFGPIRWVVNNVYNAMYGTHGVVQSMFAAVVNNPKFMGILRAVLSFYVATVAVGFLIGVIQMNTQEWIMRLVKFAVVISVISPGGWDLIYNNFFIVFVKGTQEIAGMFLLAGMSGLQSICIDSNDPSSIFSIFDMPFQAIFANSTFIKLQALCWNGLTGIVLVCLIFYAMMLYAYSIVKVIFMYLVSIVMVSLLIFTSPLFIIFSLFQFTKNFFDGWWKAMLSFALQPAMALAAVGILNVIALNIIYSMLSFSVCPVCMFSFVVPSVVNVCLIKSYKMLSQMYGGGSVSIGITDFGLFTAALMMLFIGRASILFVDFISKLVGRLCGDAAQQTQASLADTSTAAMGMTVDKGLHLAKVQAANSVQAMIKRAKAENKDDKKDDKKDEKKDRQERKAEPKGDANAGGGVEDNK